MGNSLRCCLACVLPCGALDLIRIVHLNGYVEELTGPVTAGDALKKYPNHVLTKPCSRAAGGGVARRILILSPESELKRGYIYFLIPDSSLPAAHDQKSSKKSTVKKYKSSKPKIVTADVEVAVAEKKSSSTRRRKSSEGVWRPYLESITEDL